MVSQRNMGTKLPHSSTASTFLVRLFSLVAILSTQISTAAAADCSSTLANDLPAPSLASGYSIQLLATGLSSPRGIIFDSSGKLLVVEEKKGISALSLDEDVGGCISVGDTKTVVDDDDLNHGIELSADGKTLYASSDESVFSWDYDADQSRTTSDARELINGMSNSDHSTRTLLLSKKNKGTLLVSRGSGSNFDAKAQDIKSGRSQIRAFNLKEIDDTVDYSTSGTLLGWGLRNSVGVAEEPTKGGIYSVENSADQVKRDGKDIHEDNPGEEMNFHGVLSDQRASQRGKNFGYPTCFAVWDVNTIPKNNSLAVGTQFAITDVDDNVTDKSCKDDTLPPRLTFQAHMAPLDIKFNAKGSAAWVSMHGSWNRDDPVGYKLSVIEFSDGEPADKSNSRTAARDVVSTPDLSKCPDNCIRPVGLAFDSKGRLFMSSDATGEIYVVHVPKDNFVPPANASASIKPDDTDDLASSARPLWAVSIALMTGVAMFLGL